MKRGRYKHFLDALVGKFYGYPDGIFVNSVELDDYLGFQDKTWTYDLLCGKVREKLGEEAAKSRFLKVLDSCHQWLVKEIKKENISSADLTHATFEFSIGNVYTVDRSVGSVFRPGDIQRGEGGRATSRTEPLEVPEWKAVPCLKLGIRISLVTPKKTYLYEQSEGVLEFTPPRSTG